MAEHQTEILDGVYNDPSMYVGLYLSVNIDEIKKIKEICCF